MTLWVDTFSPMAFPSLTFWPWRWEQHSTDFSLSGFHSGSLKSIFPNDGPSGGLWVFGSRVPFPCTCISTRPGPTLILHSWLLFLFGTGITRVPHAHSHNGRS